MAFNGSGLFQRLYSWVNDAANSINIRADRMDAEMDGLASGLSNCITRDGQGKPSAAIDWNGQNLSNVGALTATSGAFSGGVNGATGTFAGAVNGGSGTFTGAVSGTTGTFSGGVTAATPATGNRSTAVATTQMFANEFACSLVSPGWQKLPSGKIEQSGTTTLSTVGAFNAQTLSGTTWYSHFFTVTLPIAYTSAHFEVVASLAGIVGSVQGPETIAIVKTNKTVTLGSGESLSQFTVSITSPNTGWTPTICWKSTGV